MHDDECSFQCVRAVVNAVELLCVIGIAVVGTAVGVAVVGAADGVAEGAADGRSVGVVAGRRVGFGVAQCWYQVGFCMVLPRLYRYLTVPSCKMGK